MLALTLLTALSFYIRTRALDKMPLSFQTENYILKTFFRQHILRQIEVTRECLEMKNEQQSAQNGTKFVYSTPILLHNG